MTDFYDTDNDEYRPFEGQGGRADVDPRLTNSTANTSTVNIGSVTAAILAAANPNRIAFSAALTGGITTTNVHIRYYAAATDSIAQGADVLSRFHVGNDNQFKNSHQMTPGAIYTGEISAIAESGAVDIVVTEY